MQKSASKFELEQNEKQHYLSLKEELLKSVPNTSYNSAINFDQNFDYMDIEYDRLGNIVQEYIDQNYVVKYAGDYYHHNSRKFMKLFNKLEEGAKVTIGGQTFTCTGLESAYTDGYVIVTDNGENVFKNDTIEIITCDGPSGTPKRLVARLKKR